MSRSSWGFLAFLYLIQEKTLKTKRFFLGIVFFPHPFPKMGLFLALGLYKKSVC